MHSFLKKTLSLSLALSLLAGAASAATLTGLETETVERSWESSLFFPRMEALTGVSMEAHAVSDETQYAVMLDAMAQGDIPADVLFKANLTRAQEQALLNGGALIDLAPADRGQHAQPLRAAGRASRLESGQSVWRMAVSPPCRC